MLIYSKLVSLLSLTRLNAEFQPPLLVFYGEYHHTTPAVRKNARLKKAGKTGEEQPELSGCFFIRFHLIT